MINYVLSVGGAALSTSNQKKVAAAMAMTTNDCLSLIVSNSLAFILRYALILTQHYTQERTLFIVESESLSLYGSGHFPNSQSPIPQKISLTPLTIHHDCPLP